jgi:apolipoprotein N-acyltransferase
LAAAICSSLLLFLAYFPADQGWLAWFALVPGLVLVRADIRSRDRYLIAWFAALVFFVPALSWMRVAHEAMFYSWLGLSLYCSWFSPPAIWLVRRLDRRGWPLALSVPVVWTALELLRTHLLGGFPWYFLGHSQHNFLAVIQIADLAGVSAVTFLVAAVNGVIAEWLFTRPRLRESLGADVRRPRLSLQLGALAITIAAVLTYGGWRLSQDQFANGPVVALLQTDLDQDIRNDRVVETIEVQNQQLMQQATARQPKPDLIVWAETTYPGTWKVAHDPAPMSYEYAAWAGDISDMAAALRKLAAGAGCPVLLGLNSETFADDASAAAAQSRFEAKIQTLRASKLAGEELKSAERKAYEDLFGHLLKRFNSSLFIDVSGNVIGRYDKTHLVPFGEYVPLFEMFPFLGTLAPYAGDALNMLSSGDTFPRMQFTVAERKYSFGCMICYEDSYADIARRYVTGKESPVDFLVNQSNDGWFKRTQEHEQHLAVSRFRAIECRRALLRAVNMGISAIIDGNGRMVAMPGPRWAQSKGVMTVVSAAVPLDTRGSLYASVGDWLAWACSIGLIAGFVQRRKVAAA